MRLARASTGSNAMLNNRTSLTHNARRRKGVASPLSADPTRTATIRKAFLAALRQRFAQLRAMVVKLVLEEDAFGLAKREPVLPSQLFVLSNGMLHNCGGKGGKPGPCPSYGGSGPHDPTDPDSIPRIKEFLPPEQQEVIESWVKGDHLDPLGGRDLDADPNFQQALRNLPKVEVPIHRGVNRTPEQIARLQPGIEVPISQSQSWSKSGSFATEWAQSHETSSTRPVVYSMDNSPSARDLGDFNAIQKEAVLPKGAKVKIQSVNDFGDYVSVTLVEVTPTRNQSGVYNADAPRSWRFQSSEDKVNQFKAWIQEQYKRLVLDDRAVWEKYIKDGFDKGQGRAFDDATRTERAAATAGDRLDFYQGTRDQFLRSAFGRPIAVEKVKLLAARTFTELEGVSQQMATQMTRSLTDGLVQGKSPRDVARDLANDVDGMPRARAETIARTEIIRAHAEGQLEALEELGVEEVGVAVEWSTTGDAKVCPKCQPLEGMVVKLAEARGMLPRHPNCRCAWIPANVGEQPQGQKKTKPQVTGAIADSQAEDGQGTRWGPGAAIAKRRPRALVGNAVALSPALLAFSSLWRQLTNYSTEN